MDGAGVYPRELVPAVRPGDYVRLEPSGETYMVDLMVPQPGVKAFDSDDSNGITPGANSTSADNKASELEMPNNWLAQYRPTRLGADLDDGVEIQIDMGGKQAPLYTNKNRRGEYIDESSAEIGTDTSGTNFTADTLNHALMELYIWEDELPYFTFTETAGNNPTVSDLWFQGFQFRLESTGVPADAHVEPVPTERVRD